MFRRLQLYLSRVPKCPVVEISPLPPQARLLLGYERDDNNDDDPVSSNELSHLALPRRLYDSIRRERGQTDRNVLIPSACGVLY